MPSPPKNHCLDCAVVTYGARCLKCRGKLRTALHEAKKLAQPWKNVNPEFGARGAESIYLASGPLSVRSWWIGPDRAHWRETYVQELQRMADSKYGRLPQSSLNLWD